jgi:hypothetical protein
MLDARNRKVDEEPRLPVVATAGAGLIGSDDAASIVAARTSYPHRAKRSNQTSEGIHVLGGKGYKGEYEACRFLGRDKPRHSHPAKQLRIVRDAGVGRCGVGLGSQPSPALRPRTF